MLKFDRVLLRPAAGFEHERVRPVCGRSYNLSFPLYASGLFDTSRSSLWGRQEEF
jgi:hypothetical protein